MMKTKKIPMRTCVVSGEKLPKRELVRIVRNKEGEVFVDTTGKLNGRGVYLKKDKGILEKAKSSKILDKKLEININEEIYNELEELFSEE